MNPIVRDFLYEQVPKLGETMRWRELDRRTRYMQAKQYEGRQFDAEGYRKGSSGVYGCGSRTTPWNERDVGVSWNVATEATGELTDWAIGGKAWCALTVPDDSDAQDWLGQVARASGLPTVAVSARNFGGCIGASIISYTIREGRYVFEAHNPRDVWPLVWADEGAHRLATVAKVYRGENPVARSDDDLPTLCRVWDEAKESVYRREKTSRGEWTWIELASKPHGFGRCPVRWCPNGDAGGAHDGEPDADLASMTQVDNVNMLIAAANATTTRNADDTLVMKPVPGTDTSGRVRKGGFNVIIAESAGYLSQEGDSARICLELAEKSAVRVQRQIGVTMFDPEKIGQNTSGETLKRMFMRTINAADTLRGQIERGLIIPLCRDILEISRAFGAEAFDLPPRVSMVDIGGQPTRVVEPRSPGKSSHVQCEWPTPFPPTVQDQQAAVGTVSTATGGKAVLSQETAVAFMAASGLPIPSVAEELARIGKDEDAATERAEKAMGLAAPPPGESGPVGDEEPEEGEKKPEAAE